MLKLGVLPFTERVEPKLWYSKVAISSTREVDCQIAEVRYRKDLRVGVECWITSEPGALQKDDSLANSLRIEICQAAQTKEEGETFAAQLAKQVAKFVKDFKWAISEENKNA